MTKKTRLPSDLPDRIGAAMRSLRQEEGLTQRQVAERMGLSRLTQPLIGRYERGQRVPRVDQLLRYLEAIDSSPAAFIRRLNRSTPFSHRIRRLLQELAKLKRRSS